MLSSLHELVQCAAPLPQTLRLRTPHKPLRCASPLAQALRSPQGWCVEAAGAGSIHSTTGFGGALDRGSVGSMYSTAGAGETDTAGANKHAALKVEAEDVTSDGGTREET